MNIICMSGGLGNQMFEYALYLKFKAMGVETKFEDWTEYEGRQNARLINLKNAFEIEYPKATIYEYRQSTDSFPGILSKIRRRICGRHSSEYVEADCNFDEAVLEKRDNYLRGYFQSEKYFKDIESVVRKEFTFAESVKKRAEEILADLGVNLRSANLVDGNLSDTDLGVNLKNANLTSGNLDNTVSTDEKIYTSIHIRRGDYLDLSDNYGNICTEEYYDRAIKYILSIEPKTAFLVFSNDHEWALDWVGKYLKQGIEMTVVTGTDEDAGYIDMFIQSQCRHNIIANSSFSWWGAYLNQSEHRVVVAPNKWANHINQFDIYSDWMTRL